MALLWRILAHVQKHVIKLFVFKCLTSTKIHPNSVKVYKDSAPSFQLLNNRGLSSKRYISWTTDENIECTQYASGRSMFKNSQGVGFSEERIQYISQEELGMRKLCLRWVPLLLNADQKQKRRISQECLDRFEKNPTDFRRPFVIMEEMKMY